MKKTLIALALVAVLPLSATAAQRSYSYIEGNYAKVDGGADGFGIRGSIAFADTRFYALGQHQNFSDRGLDLNIWELGVGYALAIGNSADLITELAYVDADIADGHRVSVGLRNSFTRNVEGLFKVNYHDVSGRVGGFPLSDTGFSGTAGLLVKFNPTWGLTGGIDFGNGNEAYTLGLRASF